MISRRIDTPEREPHGSIEPRDKEAYFSLLPPAWHDPGIALDIRRDIRNLNRKLVVLDDDPTGTQTVHDVDILTRTTTDELADALCSPGNLFYILTNSRSMPADRARALQIEIVRQLANASLRTGREFDIVNRSDSTLRGHYPLEIDVLAETLQEELGWRFDAHFLIPFFKEGGRYTTDDVHWVEEKKRLIPVASTEYARDPSFSFRESNLKKWVMEKTGGRYTFDQIESITVQDLRREGPEGVTHRLGRLRGGVPVIVNCVRYADLEVFVEGLLQAERNGRRFLFRTAASFVRIRGGMENRSLLTAQEIVSSETTNGGIVMAGSYVRKTTRQLQILQKLHDIRSIELRVDRILDSFTREAEILEAARRLNDAVSSGRTGVVYTSRDQRAGRNPEETFSIGHAVSDALVDIVQKLNSLPRFIIAKGGITSSDIATRGLAIRRARVLGQIAPGIPVWKAGPESRFPAIPYVVFPGNVGDPETLTRVVEALR